MHHVNPIQDNRLAHGFNEELTIILNTATMASGMIGPGHPASRLITELKRAAIRCTNLTRRYTHR